MAPNMMKQTARSVVTAVAVLCISLLIPAHENPLAGRLEAENSKELAAPFDDTLKYPFVKDASIQCGHWGAKSQDYPYFGAPRDRNTRKHAGVDIYPSHGEGTPVTAIKSGKVIKVAPFYKRSNGEVTYGVLIDHGDFVVNYAELKKPGLRQGMQVRKGQDIGRISGTRQLHFEKYAAGTKDWIRWYGDCPSNLVDPTGMMVELLDRDNQGGTIPSRRLN
jgi:murein DD-endopeptidase MepM/ murein hydrolase activator NlpD